MAAQSAPADPQVGAIGPQFGAHLPKNYFLGEAERPVG